MAQMYWVQQFLQTYPEYCRDVANEYASHNSQSQRKATVNVLRGVKEVASTFSEDDLFFQLTQDDLICSEIPDPKD